MTFPGYTFHLRNISEEHAANAFRKVIDLDCFEEYDVTRLLVNGKDFIESGRSLHDILSFLNASKQMKMAIVGMRPNAQLSARYTYGRAGDILSLAVGLEPEEQSGKYRLTILSVGVPNYEQNHQAREIYDRWKGGLDMKVRQTLHDYL